MLNIQLAKKYAAAMFELSEEENQISTHDSQLAQIDKLFADSQDLKAYMDNPQIKNAAKKDLLQKILGNDIAKSISNFLFLLIDKHRISLLPEIVSSFHAFANEMRNIQVVYVKSASALDNAQQTSLNKKLETITGKTIEMKVTIDPAIIGGLIIKTGDRLIDGSVVGQIKSIKEQLMANC